MNKINSYYANGWLPAGLVLNSAIAPKSPTTEGNLISFAPSMPLADLGEGSIGVQQATKTSMVILKGRILSAVLLADISAEIVPSNPLVPRERSLNCMFTKVNPYADPCMLMHPARFEGTIEVWAGNDVPKNVLTVDVLGRGDVETFFLPQVYKPFAVDPSAEAQYQAALVELPCVWFVPDVAATQHLCVSNTEDVNMTSYIRGLIPTVPAQEQLTLLDSSWTAGEGDYVALLDYVSVPAYALDHTRWWRLGTGLSAHKYYSPVARIANMDGGVLESHPELQGITHLAFVPDNRASQRVLEISGALNAMDVLDAMTCLVYLPGRDKHFAVPDNCVFRSDQILSV